MKPSQTSPPNKKLILHFDVEDVVRLPSNGDKDLYVYDLCSNWVWGKLQYNSKEDPDKVTGWKLAQNSLANEKPDPDFISYKDYLDQHLNPSPEERQILILNLSKGAAAKAKNEIEKNIKNMTVPKALIEALKETNDGGKLVQKYLEDGKYQLLPVFYKLVLALKKAKRQFAIVIRNRDESDNHDMIIEELNMFFNGQHPLYNGKNGVPLVKLDGSKGNKNFVIDDNHKSVFYSFGEADLFTTFGTTLVAPGESDLELFKQKFKSRKNVKFCEGCEEIYAYSHTILSESACAYEVNSKDFVVIDPVDYLTQEIYFTSIPKEKVNLNSALGEKLDPAATSSLIQVDLFEMLRDLDYFSKKLEKCEADRVDEIQKRERGDQPAEEDVPAEEAPEQKERESSSEYLAKALIPVLDGALRQVDLLRPEDPIGFIALYCLKHKDSLEH